MGSKHAKILAKDARRTRTHGNQVIDDLERARDHLRDAAPELARQAREVIDARIEQLRGQGRDVASNAGDQLEAARVYVVDRVQGRPMTATFAALGLGFVFALFLSGRRK